MTTTSSALEILAGVTGDDDSLKAGIGQAKVNFEVAQMIYDTRTSADSHRVNWHRS